MFIFFFFIYPLPAYASYAAIVCNELHTNQLKQAFCTIAKRGEELSETALKARAPFLAITA